MVGASPFSILLRVKGLTATFALSLLHHRADFRSDPVRV